VVTGGCLRFVGPSHVVASVHGAVCVDLGCVSGAVTSATRPLDRCRATMTRRGSVRSQLQGYARQVAALSMQKVWRGCVHRRKHGIIEFVAQPNEKRAGEPFWVKGADVNSELDMYHGPVQLPEGHVLSVASASPNRSDPLPRRGGGPGKSGALACTHLRPPPPPPTPPRTPTRIPPLAHRCSPRYQSVTLAPLPRSARFVRLLVDAPVRKMSSVGSSNSDNLVSTQMPLLNHALDNGATRIQSVARGRRARKAYARQQAAAVQVQSLVRRYLSTLAVRAERRRRKVGSAIGGLAKQHAQSLHDWLIANGVRSGGRGGTADPRDTNIEQALAVRAGVTTVEQLAQMSESEVAALAARVFRGSSGACSAVPELACCCPPAALLPTDGAHAWCRRSSTGTLALRCCLPPTSAALCLWHLMPDLADDGV
jgi:hypothetical protein